MKKSKIIFLNGCSSAGKTSIVAAIQHLSDEPWLTFGIDLLFKAMPPKYLPFGEKAHEGIQFVLGVDKEGLPIMEIKSGSYGDKVGKSIPKIIKQLADDGHNLIIDEVIWERKDLENYVSFLKNHQVCLVNVICNLSLMEEREILSRDRAWGLARAQYAKMENLDWKYDLQIDANKIRPIISAEMILEHMGIKSIKDKRIKTKL
ncbi:MAG: chloramphenicol phosphotransferase [Mycoplasmataceae bacterium CE_OT135]|nr:MAG: chloramphenicol phosphotransferase [Mycoplasmataceae bacterium CE_OT135]